MIDRKNDKFDTKNDITPGGQIELGIFLKSVRERNFMSLNSLATEFKVNEKDLQKIENGENIHSSNPYFARLIAIKYAKFFNVNNEEFTSLLDNAYPKQNDALPNQNNAKNISFNNSINKKNKSRIFKRLFIYTISLVFLLALTLSLVVLLTKNVQTVSNDVQNVTTLVSNPILVPNKIVKEIPKTKVEFVEKKTINNGELNTLVYDITQMEEEKGYEVVMTAVDDVYVTIYDENWNVEKGKTLIKKGETLTFDAIGIKQLNITVDKVENVKITINEFDIKLAEQKKEGYYLIQINNKVKE